MRSFLPLLGALVCALGCAPGDRPEPSDPASHEIVGVWEVDRDASLEATESNTAGDVDAARREEMKASWRRELDAAEYVRVEIREDGTLIVSKLPHGSTEPSREVMHYVVASQDGTGMVLRMNGTVDSPVRFLTPDRIRTESAGGVLVQILDRSR